MINRILKKLIYSVLYCIYIIKCEIFYFVLKGAGLSYMIEKLPPSVNIRILKRYGAKIGEGCQIDSGLILHRIKNKSDIGKLSIGEKVYLGHNLILDLTESITIENHSAFGANCQIWTHTGDWTFNRKDESDKKGAVDVGVAVIVYSGSIISQGVKLGAYSRIAAGSVVTQDVEERTFVGGTPARVIKVRNMN